jgi:hypothetical protein
MGVMGMGQVRIFFHSLVYQERCSNPFFEQKLQELTRINSANIQAYIDFQESKGKIFSAILYRNKIA